MVTLFKDLPDLGNITISQFITVHVIGDLCLIKDLPGRGAPDTMNIGQGNFHVLFLWQINACNSSQNSIPPLIS